MLFRGQDTARNAKTQTSNQAVSVGPNVWLPRNARKLTVYAQ